MKIHPLNARGKYYVDVDNCTWCAMCNEVAPNNFKFSKNYEEGAYVFKQPETFEEEKQCEKAVFCCPHEAIFDNGKTNNL